MTLMAARRDFLESEAEVKSECIFEVGDQRWIGEKVRLD